MQRSGDDNQGGADDGAQYQIETLKRLREVNVDSNTVGWYQTTHLGRASSWGLDGGMGRISSSDLASPRLAFAAPRHTAPT